MTITEKVAYLKGLAEGLKINDEKPEGKLLLAMIDVLDDMSLTIDDLDNGLGDVSEIVDEIDQDLGDLEGDFYGDDEDEEYDDEDEEDDEDGDVYEVECPSCGDVVCINQDMLEEGEMNCPNCGELLEFDLEEDTDDKKDDKSEKPEE